MAEVDLMDQYPRSRRSPEDRAIGLTEEVSRIARQYGREYFDGDRLYGYGGYHYHPRFWQATVRRFRDYYQLAPNARILDVGCAKGFMLHDFKELLPQATVAGLDISEYAIANSIESVRPFLRVGNARDLPYESASFDLVTGINVVHHLQPDECRQALREIQRVTRAHAFVVVDAYRTPEEKERLEKWLLFPQTYMHVDEWRKVFREVGYAGDYYWFILD